MSVLIKGMEMPKEGMCKTITIFDYGAVVEGNGSEKLGIAVPVPDHGRLIDADALEYEEAYLNGHYELGDIEIVTREDIESAPTIIPADKEAEEVKEKPIWEQLGYDFDPPYPASTPVITNYDRLISKTPEEMADWLCQTQYREGDFCPPKHEGQYCIMADGCRVCWLDWLKSPVEVDDGI